MKVNIIILYVYREQQPICEQQPRLRLLWLLYTYSTVFCIRNSYLIRTLSLLQGIKDDDTKSVVSVDSRISEDKASVGTVEGEGKKDLWQKIANRRREQKFGTLSQNFVRNFKSVYDILFLYLVCTKVFKSIT